MDDEPRASSPGAPEAAPRSTPTYPGQGIPAVPGPAEPVGPEPAGPRGTRGRIVVVVLSIALALAAAAAVVLAVLLARGSDVSATEVGEFLQNEEQEVDERARTVIDLLLNYDATNIEEVADGMLEVSTGNFRQQYEELIVGGTAGAGLAEALEEVAASSRGQLLEGPDVAFRSPAEAVAIARVTQTTQSNENPTGRTIEYVLELTLVNTTDGGWKADRVEVLSQRESL